MANDTSKPRESGVVTWFDAEKGYGFISPDTKGKDIFVHWTGIEGTGFRRLAQDQRVTYRLEVSERNGRLQAVEVTVQK